MTLTQHARGPDAGPVAGAVLFFRGHSARIVDAVLVGLIIMRTGTPFLPINVPFAQVALIALLAVVAFRRPTRSLEGARWYPLVATALLFFLTAVSVFQDVDFVRRLGNIAVLMTVAGFIASGRIEIGSALKGLGIALVVNLVLFYVGIAPDTYGGVLTGYLSDKNAAGLVYGIGALLYSLTTTRVWFRVLILLGGAGALVLTDSRTSMAAYAAACVWIIVAPWIGGVFKVLLGGALAFGFFWADANLSDAGQYAETRAGSDALRARIDEASEAKVAETPWFGGGLGEASVWIDDSFWFFHNAYQGLLAEGGYVALIVVVAIYMLVGFGFLRRSARSYASTGVAAATVFLLFAATRLGEVFFAPIGFILLGVGLALIVEHDPFRVKGSLHVASDRDLVARR